MYNCVYLVILCNCMFLIQPLGCNIINKVELSKVYFMCYLLRLRLKNHKTLRRYTIVRTGDEEDYYNPLTKFT